MVRLADYSVAEVRALQDRLRQALETADSLEGAAQRLTELVTAEFGTTVVLARAYATIPFRLLPIQNRQFVQKVAREGGVEALLTPEMPILSLVGTHGSNPDWQNWRTSRNHIGIPLASAAFVESMPMVSALLSDLPSVGVTRPAHSKAASGLIHRLIGGDGSSIFHVDDAKKAVDRRGRKVIPSQQFVLAYDIKTVFGMGGSWPDGSLSAFVVFTRETISLAVVRRLAPLMTVFRSCTTSLVMRGRYFAGGLAPASTVATS
jgi:hypothetical protein